MKSKGLGDTIAKVTKATGIKKVVDLLFDSCGCDERKEKLNKIFPYKVECLDESEYNYLKELFKSEPRQLSYNKREDIRKIYNRVFNKRQKNTTCASCWTPILNQLKTLYNEYNDETKD
tara:strand:+ start:10322 stop:10678 length:357 start_codon:yes stop_codon:yes gene_type:complete